MEDISEIEKLFKDCLPEAKNKIKKYSIDFKLKVLKLLDLNVSMHKIEGRLGINRKSIREWRDKKNLLLNINSKSVRYRLYLKIFKKFRFIFSYINYNILFKFKNLLYKYYI